MLLASLFALLAALLAAPVLVLALHSLRIPSDSAAPSVPPGHGTQPSPSRAPPRPWALFLRNALLSLCALFLLWAALSLSAVRDARLRAEGAHGQAERDTLACRAELAAQDLAWRGKLDAIAEELPECRPPPLELRKFSGDPRSREL